MLVDMEDECDREKSRGKSSTHRKKAHMERRKQSDTRQSISSDMDPGRDASKQSVSKHPKSARRSYVKALKARQDACARSRIAPASDEEKRIHTEQRDTRADKGADRKTIPPDAIALTNAAELVHMLNNDRVASHRQTAGMLRQIEDLEEANRDTALQSLEAMDTQQRTILGQAEVIREKTGEILEHKKQLELSEERHKAERTDRPPK